MSFTPKNCHYLTVEMTREIHDATTPSLPGPNGVPNMFMLEASVAVPQARSRGKSPYEDLPEVAAAYLFYICRNHPFIDGNKRAALGACLVFLRLNDIEPEPDGPEWEQLTLDVASSALDRDETTARLRKLLRVRK